ncbi:MAG: hypothetical protein KAS17_04755 [Victivallaceae bacterium]|nr:hypothetical protein [Victivallaceae bacterium]
MFDGGNFNDKALDFFGVSTQDSYRKGYDRGFKGKVREPDLIGDLFGSSPSLKSQKNSFSSRFGSRDVTGGQHRYEFNKGMMMVNLIVVVFGK